MQKIQCVIAFGILAAGGGLAFTGDRPLPVPPTLSERGLPLLLAAPVQPRTWLRRATLEGAVVDDRAGDGLTGRGHLFLLAAMTASASVLSAAGGNRGETPSRPARTGFVYDEVYLRHHTGAGHPERPERLTAIVERLKQKGLLADVDRSQTRGGFNPVAHHGPYPGIRREGQAELPGRDRLCGHARRARIGRLIRGCAGGGRGCAMRD